jgi:hypothetical protein
LKTGEMKINVLHVRTVEGGEEYETDIKKKTIYFVSEQDSLF